MVEHFVQRGILAAMTKGTLVGILMGSDSDLPIMQDAAKVLDEFGVSYRITVLSAHRTPEKVVTFVRDGEAAGYKAFIAGAGGAAHLAGAVAAQTTLPVIGVPILGKSTDGLDSLLSTVQMPPGVPVATVAVNGAKNAGLLALQIIGAYDDTVRAKLRAHKAKMAAEVTAKAEKLEALGYAAYQKSV